MKLCVDAFDGSKDGYAFYRVVKIRNGMGGRVSATNDPDTEEGDGNDGQVPDGGNGGEDEDDRVDLVGRHCLG